MPNIAFEIATLKKVFHVATFYNSVKFTPNNIFYFRESGLKYFECFWHFCSIACHHGCNVARDMANEASSRGEGVWRAQNGL